MARQPHQLVTQRAGVTILCRLGTGCGAAGLTSLRNADGLEAVAGALNRHANDSYVAAQAAELLFAIASAAEEPGRRRGAADVYLQNGAIDGLLKAMLKHPTHDQLQRCAARTLIAASLISDRARLTVFGKSGARSLIVAAVRRLPDIASDCHLNLITELIQPQHLSAEERLMRQMEQTRIENKLIERALDTDLDGDGIIGAEEEDLAVYAALKSPRRLTTPRSARRELGGKMVTPRKAGFIPGGAGERAQRRAVNESILYGPPKRDELGRPLPTTCAPPGTYAPAHPAGSNNQWAPGKGSRMLKDQHSAVRDLYAFEKRLEYEAEEAADKKRRGISDDEPFSPAVAKAKRKAAAEKKAKAAAAAAEKKSAALRARNWVKGTPTSYEHPPAAACAHNPLLARARQYKEVGDEAEEVAMNYVRWSPRGGPHPPPIPVDAAEQPPSRPRTALPHKEPAVVVLSARARTPYQLDGGRRRSWADAAAGRSAFIGVTACRSQRDEPAAC